MGDKILKSLVPKEKNDRNQNGKRRGWKSAFSQGYVLVQMKMSEDAWYIVRNALSHRLRGLRCRPPVGTDEVRKSRSAWA